MVAATGQPRDELCTRLLQRRLPDRAARARPLGKHLLELPLEVNGEASGDASAPLRWATSTRHADGAGVGGGAADALTRP